MDLITFVILLMLLSFYVLGLLILWSAVITIRDGFGARKWPTVRASLDTCTTVVRGARQRHTWYDVQVKYSYMVDGVPYVGDTVSMCYNYMKDQNRHEDRVRRITDMTPFVIRHHPTLPHRSTIFLSTTPAIFGTFILAMFYLGFTSGMLALGIEHGTIRLPYWG